MGNCDQCGEVCDYCNTPEIPIQDIRKCYRVDCAFEWIFTGAYIECPLCELRALKAKVAP